MRLIEYRSAVVTAIAASGLFRDVAAHGGRFDEAEVKRFSLKSPACRVALVGVPRLQRDNTGLFLGPVEAAAWVITQGRDPMTEAIDLAERLAALVDLNQWGMGDVVPAIVQQVQFLWTSEASADGVALAAVAFEQEVSFGVCRFAEDTADDPYAEIGTWPTSLSVSANGGEPEIME